MSLTAHMHFWKAQEQSAWEEVNRLWKRPMLSKNCSPPNPFILALSNNTCNITLFLHLSKVIMEDEHEALHARLHVITMWPFTAFQSSGMVSYTNCYFGKNTLKRHQQLILESDTVNSHFQSSTIDNWTSPGFTSDCLPHELQFLSECSRWSAELLFHMWYTV